MTAVEFEASGAGRSTVLNSAVLDEAHVGDIRGALGTIRLDDHAARTTLSAKFKTLLAVVGPGLIVMVGDNDAGAFSTYGQAGQVYGTKLLWTLLLLIPVLYVNQEMVLRLGAVTGVGHARLILSRFGKFWGTFEVIDLFLLNGLTIVTEFIGIALAAGYLGVPKVLAVILAAGIIIATAFTGSFRAFERIAMFFCVGSLLLIPLFLMAHPSGSAMADGFATPDLPAGASGGMAAVMLLVIGIVGTTIAPWQLFFQQSYVIDKRITPRFMKYEKADLWIGIVIVVVGAAALMGTTAVAFAHSGVAFTDSAGLARGIAGYAGHVAGALFAVALLDAAVIGAFAVSLSSAYAIGDVLGMKHSLHRGVGQAKGFYALYAALVGGAAAIVLIPGSPLGLITEGVQVLAGVLLPAATVFLLMLCNDKAVLGPWVNTAKTNAFTGGVIAVLITLSVVLTASVMFPAITAVQIFTIMGGCAAVAVAIGGFAVVRGRRTTVIEAEIAQEVAAAANTALAPVDKLSWRMPPLSELSAPAITGARRIGLIGLRAYLAIAMVMVVVKIVLLAVGH
ncbi:MAG TPA: NRAMP family divalent metal transporter [Trebonia sp.]|nr:NRAMP family divalent metal transporter [Trebonia sp.]